MKIKMKYETLEVEMDVDVNELTGWLSIEVVEEENEVELQKRIQEEIDKQYNRPDYNNWHRHNRHIGYSKAVSEDGEDSFGHFKEPLIEKVRDKSIFFKDEIKRNHQEEYENCCKFIAEHIKKQELLDLFIKFVFEDYTLREIAMIQNPRKDGMSEKEYKKLISKVENNLSHKLVRVRKKLQEISSKTSDFDGTRGYLIEDESSRNL